MSTRVEELNLGHRARNCVALLGVGTAEELADVPQNPLTWRNSGMATAVQVTRALLRKGITPVWLRSFAPLIDYRDVTVDKDGMGGEWREVAGPYNLPAEAFMLEHVIADLERGGVAWQLAPWDGEGGGFMLYRRGGVAVAAEEGVA